MASTWILHRWILVWLKCNITDQSFSQQCEGQKVIRFRRQLLFILTFIFDKCVWNSKNRRNLRSKHFLSTVYCSRHVCKSKAHFFAKFNIKYLEFSKTFKLGMINMVRFKLLPTQNHCFNSQQFWEKWVKRIQAV